MAIEEPKYTVIEASEKLVKNAEKCRIKKKSIELAEFEIMREHRDKKNWNSN